MATELANYPLFASSCIVNYKNGRKPYSYYLGRYIATLGVGMQFILDSSVYKLQEVKI